MPFGMINRFAPKFSRRDNDGGEHPLPNLRGSMAIRISDSDSLLNAHRNRKRSVVAIQVTLPRDEWDSFRKETSTWARSRGPERSNFLTWLQRRAMFATKGQSRGKDTPASVSIVRIQDAVRGANQRQQQVTFALGKPKLMAEDPTSAWPAAANRTCGKQRSRPKSRMRGRAPQRARSRYSSAAFAGGN